MWNRLQALGAKLKPLSPSTAAGKKLVVGALMLGAIGVAFMLGRQGALSDCQADPPPQPVLQEQGASQGAPGDYAQRVVAYIYGNMPITREELGEYLIARFGAERAEFLVNRRIVDMACRSRGIYVTDGEIHAQLLEDLKAFNIP